MANEQNLIPQAHVLTVEEQSKGGKASGAARRRKRTLKQAVDLAMSLPVTDPKRKDKLSEMGIAEDDADNQMAVVVGLMLKAMNGNPKAAELLFNQMDDENASTAEQTEAHNSLIDAIRMRNNED